jgi:hypothetical protein
LGCTGEPANPNTKIQTSIAASLRYIQSVGKFHAEAAQHIAGSVWRKRANAALEISIPV